MPHINILNTYEDSGITYYVCDIQTKQFDDKAGSLATACRIGLTDNGDGTYTVKSGLLPPSGVDCSRVLWEVFDPLDELYQQRVHL